jgi:WD40 repeat protein
VLFSRDGSRIFSCSQDRTVKIWDAASGQLLSTLNGHRDVVTTCASSLDETFRFVSGSGDGVLKIWDARTGQELFTLTGHTGAIRSCAFSLDGSQIISASMDRTLKLWDAHNGQLLFTLEGHEGWVLTCAFSPDGKYVLSGSEDQFLKLWEAASGKEICGYWTGAPIQTASWHPKASRLAVWDGDGQLHLLELERGDRAVGYSPF